MGTPVRLQRYLAAAGVAARRKAEELITAGRVKVNGEVVTRPRHQGRSGRRSGRGRRRGGRPARHVLRPVQQAEGLHHRGHRRPRPADGDGLPAEPAGAGEAGRSPRLLHRGRAAADERRRARRAPARAGEPRAEDLSRQGARPAHPGGSEAPARGRPARRRHRHACPPRSQFLPGESKHTWLADHDPRGQAPPDPPHDRGARLQRRQAAARRVREPDVPRSARRRRARAHAAGAQRAARLGRPRSQRGRARRVARAPRGDRHPAPRPRQGARRGRSGPARAGPAPAGRPDRSGDPDRRPRRLARRAERRR